jgi:hypothetical protein
VARALLWEAVSAQPALFDRSAVESWFRRHAPWVDRLLVDGILTGGTVNDRGRQHVPQPEDVLFLRADGRFERYDPFYHGRWSKLGRPQNGASETSTRAGPIRVAFADATFGPAPIGVASPRERFADEAREAMAAVVGTDLRPGEVRLRGQVRHGFDLVSSDGRTVGDALWLGNTSLGWARLGEGIWMLQQVAAATRRFVVLGGDRDLAERWLAERGPLADGIDVYFLGRGGPVDLRAEAYRRHRPAV